MAPLLPWAMGVLVVVAGVLQWKIVRAMHRKTLAALRVRHQQQQQAGVARLDQARRQIAQLQQELAAARLELKHRRERPPASAPGAFAVRQVPRRSADEATPPRRGLPVDGFADTLPSLQFPHANELLAR